LVQKSLRETFKNEGVPIISNEGFSTIERGVHTYLVVTIRTEKLLMR